MRDVINFIEGKLNSDIDVAFMPVGDFPVDPDQQHSGIYNLIHEKGKYGVLTNIKGSTEISLSHNGEKILCGAYDSENNALILLVYDSGGAHKIYRYYNDGTEEEIYGSTGGISLGFTLTEKIRKAIVIGSGTDTMLAWASDVNPPRCVNLNRYLSGDYVSGEDFISLAKDAPVKIPTVTIGSNTSIPSNNLYNKGYQFAIKFIYFDGKESSWSDYSMPIYPSQGHESVDSVFNTYIELYNKLTITYTSIPGGVSKVYIGVRYVDIGSGDAGSWYLYDVVDVDLGTQSITYTFYDNKIKQLLDQDDIAILGYEVPLLAKDILLSKDNRFMFVDPKLGYDNVAIDISLSMVYNDSSYSIYNTANSTVTASTGSTAVINLNIVQNTTMYFIFVSDNAIVPSFSLKLNIGKSSDDYAYQAANIFLAYFQDAGLVTATCARTGTNQITMNTNAPATYSVYQNIINTGSLRHRTQPLGAIYYFALGYQDVKGRKWRANISSTSFISIPTPESIGVYPFSFTTDENLRYAIAYEISHEAPSEAVAWEILFGGSNISNRYEIPLICSDNLDETPDITVDEGYIYLDVNQSDTRILARNGKYSSLISFDAQKGDRVRFISKTAYNNYVGASWRMNNYWSYFSNNIDLEIVDVDETGILKIESNIKNSEYDDIVGAGSYDWIKIEVYRINKDVSAENLVYKSIGQKGVVSGGYHQYTAESGTWYLPSTGNAITPRNQTGAQSCIGTFICDGNGIVMDVAETIISTTNISILISKIHANRMSFAYDSIWQPGKINYVDTQYGQKTIRGIVYGGSYSEDGFIFDELNKFVEGDRKDFEDSGGDTCAVEIIGYTVKAFQRSRVVTIGNLININYNSDGTSYQVAINDVLGDPTPLGDDFGTIFSLSVVRYKWYVYFYDIYKHSPVRNSYNGNDEITFSMSKFWEIRSKALLESGVENLNVCAYYDTKLDMYVISIRDSVTSTNSFTACFSESAKAWKVFLSYIPDKYVQMSDTRYFYIEDDELWELHTNVLRTRFSDSTDGSYLTVVHNSNPEIDKVYDTLHENSNGIFEAAENDSVITGENSIEYIDSENYTRHGIKGQTKMTADKFGFKGLGYEAPFGNNMITNQSTPSIYDLVNGDPITGKYVKMKLENNDTDEINIKSVSVSYRPLKGQ